MLNRFYRFCMWVMVVLSSLLFGVLAIASFFRSAYVEDAYQIKIILGHDNILWNLLFLAVFLLLCGLLCALFSRIRHGKELLLVLTCLWVFGASLVWTYVSKAGPASDCGSVYMVAKQFARNDYSALSYRDSYFSCYPFQLGLAFFYELIFRLLHNDNFHLLQGVNAICLAVITFSQYHLTGIFAKAVFSGNENLSSEEVQAKVSRAQILGLVITALNLPFIMYGSYIYGEIPSFAFLLFGSLMLLWTLEKKSRLCGTLGFLSVAMGMLVRKNSLIFLIALCIIALLILLKKRAELGKGGCIRLVVYIAALTVVSVMIIPAIQALYAHRSGTEINAGVPTKAYLAMGLMEAEAGPGHYNGYNYETFTVTADYDSEKASEIAGAAYRELLSQHMSDLPAFGGFLATKFLHQWLNAGWAVYDSIYVAFGERSPFIESCFSGSMYPVIIFYMTRFQFVYYLMAAIYCIRMFILQKKKTDVGPESFLFLLTAIGGAIFYLMWEASGRYVLPYALFVLPNVAIGMAMVFSLHKYEKSGGNLHE